MLKLRTTRRALATAAATLALAGGVTAATAGSASAAWRNGEMYNLAKSECLDGGGGWVSTWGCNGSPVQIWRDIAPTTDSTYQLSDNAGQCLDGGQSNGLFSCNGGDWQRWTVEKVGSVDGRTYYRFRWAHDASKCLDGGQSRQAMWFPCNGGAWQMWSWN